MKQEKLAIFFENVASFSLLFNGTMHFSSRRNKKTSIRWLHRFFYPFRGISVESFLSVPFLRLSGERFLQFKQEL